ncbi:MAG: cache domain-containing protein, partial [Acetivibrionales bacterium]
MDVLRETMPKAADEASAIIEFAIQNQLNSLNIISSLDFMKILKDNNADDSALKSFMSDEIRRTGHKQMILADRNGKILYSNSAVTGIKDDPFFMSALSGVETVSEPMLDEDGSGIIMVYAVPVKIDGEIAGVLMAYRDGLELSEFVGRVRYGESGQAYLINRQGRTIAHANKDIILQILETATSDATSSATSAADTSDAVSSATSDPQAADAVSSATAGAGGEISDAQLRARERTSSQV